MSNSVTEKTPAVMWTHIAEKWFWNKCLIIPLSFFSGSFVLKDDDGNAHEIPTLKELDAHIDAEVLLPLLHLHDEVDELVGDYWEPVDAIDTKWQICQHILTAEKGARTIFGPRTA